jgi:hypothetical protein
VWVWKIGTNVADSFVGPVTVTDWLADGPVYGADAPVPVPFQLSNAYPDEGVALSVSGVPAPTHVVPAPVTLPPTLAVTVNANCSVNATLVDPFDVTATGLRLPATYRVPGPSYTAGTTSVYVPFSPVRFRLDVAPAALAFPVLTDTFHATLSGNPVSVTVSQNTAGAGNTRYSNDALSHTGPAIVTPIVELAPATDPFPLAFQPTN